MKLWQLPAEIAEIEALLDEEQESDSSIEELLNSLNMEFNGKIEWLAKMVRNEDAEAKKFKVEADHFTDKAKAAKNRMERTRLFIKLLMDARETKKVEGEHLKVTIQKNPQSVDVYDETDILAEYWVTPDPVLNKRAILEQLKDGVVVSGCALRQTESVRIK